MAVAIVKPKHNSMLRYGTELRCYIYLKPQQKWIVHALNENYVNLESKSKKIEIQISSKDFSKLFDFII